MTDRSTSEPKKWFFWLITLLFPLLFFVALEVGLRLANYGGNTQLFKETRINNIDYLLPNRNFAARYFKNTSIIPTPSNDVLRKEKPENGFRIIAIGGSSMAGFPYHYNVISSHVVRDVYQEAYPDRFVEACNLGVSAINSYTLIDILPEVLAVEPDLVLIYAGHNEYYGALGVGSSESVGQFPGLVRLYLKLQHFKSFLLLQDAIRVLLKGLFAQPNAQDSTLMEQMVQDQQIALNSTAYELGIAQFESNMRLILSELKQAGVEVAIGTLASNVRDFKPFKAIESESPNALEQFTAGRDAWLAGDTLQAQQRLLAAKEQDGLRFRAPEAINEVIADLAKAHDAQLVDVKGHLEQQSPGQMIGNEWMLEHLHPNEAGYFELGWAFAKTLQPEVARNERKSHFSQQVGYTAYDRALAKLRILSIESAWPFQPPGTSIPYLEQFTPQSIDDSLALQSYLNKISWQEGREQLAARAVEKGNLLLALNYLKGTARVFPWRVDVLEKIASIYNDTGNISAAITVLRQANHERETPFNTKILGALLLQQNKLDEGLPFLERAYALNPTDPQNLYNLSGAYGVKNDFERARDILDKLLQINPNFPGAREWDQQLKKLMRN